MNAFTVAVTKPLIDWLHVSDERGFTQRSHRFLYNLMRDTLISVCQNSLNDLSMPNKAILHAQRSTEGTVTARNTGQAILKYPEPVPARAATTEYNQSIPCAT
eukprot:1371319-Pleurochrysis_carterae.AAC.2